MASQPFVTRETVKKSPILIIDKSGRLSGELCRLLYREFLPVVVSEAGVPEDLSTHVVRIPFKRKAPKIPENAFVHIFFVDAENRYVRAMIPSVLSFAKKTNTNMSIITSLYAKKLRNFEKLSTNPLVRIFVVGDVFSHDQTSDSPVSHLLEKAFYEKKIVLEESGLDEIYTTSSFEVAKSIVDLTFSHHVPQSLINMYTDYPLSYVSLARHILQIDPDVRLDFKNSKHKRLQVKWLPKDGWHVSLTPIHLQLKDVYSLFLKEVRGEVKKAKRQHAFSHPFGPYIAGVGFSLFLILLLPFLIIISSAFLGKELTMQSVGQLERGEYVASRVTSKNSEVAFEFANKLTKLFIPLGAGVGRGEMLTTFSQTLVAGIEVNHILIDMSYALESYAQSTSMSDRSKATEKVTSALQSAKQATLALLHVSESGRLPDEYAERVQTALDAGGYVLSLSDVLPEVLGYSRPKTYLVLFQNNNELRPGGGFIGSYGLLHLDKGKISAFTIHDVYDADGQLSASVEPPKPLKDYMGVTHWFLRDSNFSPDFIENAARAAYFLKLETGESVDGVFAIDTTFLQGILRATGPVRVEEYGETVTADTFAEKTQSHIEDSFFPGSQTKRTFLSAVSSDITEKIINGSGVSRDVLLAAFVEAVSQKHLMVALADQSLQLPFTALNLSGALWDPRTSDEEKIDDFLGIIEANLGLNKVNPYIERYINQTTTFTEEGKLQTEVSIRYKNTSSQSTKFGGIYKNYLQLLLPLDADVAGLSIDGKEKVLLSSDQATITRNIESAEVKNALQIDRGEVSGRRSVGFLIEVPIGKTVTLDVLLQKDTPFTLNSSKIDYSVYLFKQAGRLSDPYTFTFVYPDSFQLLSKSDDLKGRSGEVTSFFLLDSDKELTVSLGRK